MTDQSAEVKPIQQAKEAEKEQILQRIKDIDQRRMNLWTERQRQVRRLRELETGKRKAEMEQVDGLL